MARPDETDMSPKRNKLVRFGINLTQIRLNDLASCVKLGLLFYYFVLVISFKVVNKLLLQALSDSQLGYSEKGMKSQGNRILYSQSVYKSSTICCNPFLCRNQRSYSHR